ncbi:MAG: hypothetical protein ACYC2G_06005 [Gemmatimonadaceae bacterium]
MKMLMVIYSGDTPQLISSLLDDHCVGGYTEFRNVRGAGVTGRREGSRAWPGESTLLVSVVPEQTAGDLVDVLRHEAGLLPVGERLHVAVLPTDTFF